LRSLTSSVCVATCLAIASAAAVNDVYSPPCPPSKPKAPDLMMQVHSQGKAVGSTGSLDKMEADVRRLHAAGLWATMQRDDT